MTQINQKEAISKSYIIENLPARLLTQIQQLAEQNNRSINEQLIISLQHGVWLGLTRKAGRQAGSAKGLVEISDDFDEPLEDFQDYM